MNWFKIPALFKFFLGTLLIQGVTAILVYAALNNPTAENQMLLAAVGAALGLVGSLWFTTIAGSDKKEALARATERLSKEREKIRVRAEKEKSKIREQTQKQASKRVNLPASKSHFKMGASTLGLVGVGGLLLVTQFVSLGMLVMGVSGGALGGYLMRVRQEQKKKSATGDSEGLLTRGWSNQLSVEGETEGAAKKKRLKVIKNDR